MLHHSLLCLDSLILPLAITRDGKVCILERSLSVVETLTRLCLELYRLHDEWLMKYWPFSSEKKRARIPFMNLAGFSTWCKFNPSG